MEPIIDRRLFFKIAATGVAGYFASPMEIFAQSSSWNSNATILGTAKNVIFVLCPGAPSQIDLWDYKPGLRQRFNQDLPDSILDSSREVGGEAGRYRDAVRQEKRQLIINAVREAAGNYTEAAKRLGVHPNYLHRLIRNLDLKAEIRKAVGH